MGELRLSQDPRTQRKRVQVTPTPEIKADSYWTRIGKRRYPENRAQDQREERPKVRVLEAEATGLASHGSRTGLQGGQKGFCGTHKILPLLTGF